MALTVARYEGVIERKIDELQGHRDAALRAVLHAYAQGDSKLFGKAAAVFESTGPTMDGLTELKDIDSIAVTSLTELIGGVEIARIQLESPDPLISNN